MLAAIRAVGFTYMASSAGSVGSRRAGLQRDDTIPRTVRDTIRPTLPELWSLSRRLDDVGSSGTLDRDGRHRPAGAFRKPSVCVPIVRGAG